MKKSFRDPQLNVLTAWGYASFNGQDLARDEPDDFNLEPGKWQLVGDEWQPYEPPVDILAEINRIEAETGVVRVVREGLLLFAEDKAQREAERLAAEGTPTTAEELLAQNIGYCKAKALDDQIAALRAQL